MKPEDVRDSIGKFSLAQIIFLLFLRDNSPAYDMPLQQIEFASITQCCYNSEMLVTAYLFEQSS